MYVYAVAFADEESGELLCLDHPLPFAAGEEIWFEEPCRREEGLVTTAHVMAMGVTGEREITIAMPVNCDDVHKLASPAVARLLVQ